MDDNLNKAIAEQLRPIALEVWDQVTYLRYGTFTAGDIVENNSLAKRSSQMIFDDMNWPDNLYEEVELKCGNFSCKFRYGNVFSILDHFEKLAGIKKENRQHFIAKKKSVSQCNITFTLDKRHTEAARYVSNDTYREVMTGVAIDLVHGYVVSTNGSILYVQPIDIHIDGVTGIHQVVIPIDVFKKLKGTVTIGLNKNRYEDVISCETGSWVGTIAGNYPYWWKIISRGSINMVCVVDTKKFRDMVKKVWPLTSKTNNNCVKMIAKDDRMYMHVMHIDENKKQVSDACVYNIPCNVVAVKSGPMGKAINLSLLRSVPSDWDGAVYMTNPSQPIYLNMKTKGAYFLAMPMYLDDQDKVRYRTPSEDVFADTFPETEEWKAMRERKKNVSTLPPFLYVFYLKKEAVAV